MIDTQLILVDGIPGSGKSTTAQWIALELWKRNIAADWFMDEHRGNPVTVWEDLTTDQFITRTMEKWTQLSRMASTSVMVLEGCVFQQIVGRLFSEDMEHSQIHRHIQAITDTVRHLNPVVIYFYQADLARAWQTITTERGPGWTLAMLEGFNQSPFALARQISGFDAQVKFYQEYRAFTDPLGAALGLRTLAIENSARDWSSYQAQIHQFLSLPTMTDEPISPEYLTRFAGRFRDLSGTHPHNPECAIKLEQGQLVVYDFRYPRSRLIPKTPQAFHVETLGYEISFEVDEQGQASKMKVSGKEPGVGIGSVTLLGREYQRILDT